MTSECGFKEEIDRKEFQYKEEIETFQNRIKDINLISSLTQAEIDNIMRQNEDFEKNNQIIEMRQKQIKQMEQKDQQLSDVIEIFIKQEKTLKDVIQFN